MKRKISLFLCLTAVLSILLTGCDVLNSLLEGDDGGGPRAPSVSLDSIPEFDGSTPYVIINENIPFFTDERTDSSYESFSELDELGRCGTALACIGVDLMPTEDREPIGHVTPSGWQSVKYDVVPGKNLYNRCHLIGFQLTGENDNEKNLITGTRDMNNEGMLPFENMIADYVKETENHVLYRVTPIYEGTELVARGVLMEAKSVEDDDICLCVYFYNAQPGVTINYKTGESRLADDPLGDLINDNHEGLDILPSAIPDSVRAIYEETEDGLFSGCLITVTVRGYASNITLAVDIGEGGKVISVAVISEAETHGKGKLDSFISGFSGKDGESVDSVLLVSGATATSEAVRGGVKDALTAFECYTDALENGKVFVINVSSEKFHLENCRWAESISDENKLVYIGYAPDLIEDGYSPCGTCKPAN